MAKRNEQRDVAQAIRAKRGLAPLLQSQGGDQEVVDAAELIESIPGGPELLYSFAAEQLLNKAGASKKDTRKVRLFEIGGYVKKAEGGLAAAAETTRKGGRGGDSMIVHMTPEELGIIETMWGKADTNPDTGMPEYGFFSDIWKKVKKAVKKVFSSKIFQIVAPIALSIFAPGLGAAIGGKLLGGASAMTQSIVGNALLRGGMSAAGGGDFLQGAMTGAISGGLGQVVGDQVGKLAPGLSEGTTDLIGASLASGAGAELGGGDFVSGAMSGALTEMMQPTVESLGEKGRDVLGLTADEGATFARRMTDAERVAAEAAAAGTEGALAQATTPTEDFLDPGEMGPPAELAGPAPEQMGPPAPTGAEAAPTGAEAAPAPAGQEDMLMKYGLPLMTAMGALGGGEYEEGEPPPIPPHMLEPLPLYESQRQFIGPTDPQAYYTYGMPGAPQTGESLFITPQPFAGETGTPTATGGLEAAGTPMGQGIRGMIASGQIVPGNMVRGQGGMLRNAGYTQGQDGNWYPPGQQQLGQGTGFAMGGLHEQRFQRGGEFDYWAQNADVQRVSPTVSAAGRYVKGPGTGRSDDIPARLSDGEYVIDAESVALLGDGSGDAGAKRLDEMRRNLRQHKSQNLSKGGFSHKAKSPASYMPRLRAAAGRA